MNVGCTKKGFKKGLIERKKPESPSRASKNFFAS